MFDLLFAPGIDPPFGRFKVLFFSSLFRIFSIHNNFVFSFFSGADYSYF